MKEITFLDLTQNTEQNFANYSIVFFGSVEKDEPILSTGRICDFLAALCLVDGKKTGRKMLNKNGKITFLDLIQNTEQRFR